MRQIKKKLISTSIAILSSVGICAIPVSGQQEATQLENCKDPRNKRYLNYEQVAKLNQQGWKGIPFAFFDWEEIPWGMPLQEFQRLYNKYMFQCAEGHRSFFGGKNYKNSAYIETGPEWVTMKFYFERINEKSEFTLSRILYSSMNQNFFQEIHMRYGEPDESTFYRPAGGFVNNEPAGYYQIPPKMGGVWVLKKTRIWGVAQTTILTPTDPRLQSQFEIK